MKKYLSLILSVLLVMSFAASAFAIHAEIPAETQAVVSKGATQITLGGFLRTRGWYFNNLTPAGLPDDTNSRAFLDQRVKLLVNAQVTPNVQGLFELQGDQVWGSAGPNQKGDALKWIQAWIQYTGSGLFGFNSGLKVGHMPLALGHQTFFQHTTNGDDAIVFFMDPTKNVHIGLLAVKLNEGSAAVNSDDLDGYVALTTFKLDEKNTVGANYTYLNQSNADFKLQNVGLHANGSVAGFGYKAEGNIQFGDINDDVKARGYSIMAGVNYALNPVNVRASFGLGSGDDDDDDKAEQFISFLSDTEHYTQVYDYKAVTAAGSTLTGLSNTTYYNLGVDYTVSPSIKTSLDGYLLRATKAEGSKKVGWEVDAKVVYNVARNLNYIFDVGYFDAGKFYEDAFGVDEKAATLVRQQLILSF